MSAKFQPLFCNLSNFTKRMEMIRFKRINNRDANFKNVIALFYKKKEKK